MALKAKFNPATVVRKKVEYVETQADELVFQVLSYVGESFITEARNSGSYTDRTGNLRSSVGYLISKNGQVMKSDFKGDAEGSQQGRQYAESLLNGAPSKWVFIGVAGMEYAAAVESKGKEVISSSSESARVLLIRLLEKAKQRFK